jgi:hypothetical protein
VVGSSPNRRTRKELVHKRDELVAALRKQAKESVEAKAEPST